MGPSINRKVATALPIPFHIKAAPTTSLSPEDSTSKLWSGNSCTYNSASSWNTYRSSYPTPPPPSPSDSLDSLASQFSLARKNNFPVTPEESRSNITCAFPSWPNRTALTEQQGPTTPSAYISDEDLLWSCTPSEEPATPDCINGTNGTNCASTAYKPVSPASEVPVVDPRAAELASLDEKEQARRFRAAQKQAMKLAQMAMVAAAKDKGVAGKRRKPVGKVLMAEKRRRSPLARHA